MGDIPLDQILQAPSSGYVQGYFEGTKDSEGNAVKWGRGSSFCVKTLEGNYAKLRMIVIDKEKHVMVISYKITGNSQGRFIN